MALCSAELLLRWVGIRSQAELPAALVQEVKRKFRRGEILEGQVTRASIVDAIAKQRRIDIAPELVELPAPLITHGTFDVPLGVLTPAGEKAVLKVVVAK